MKKALMIFGIILVIVGILALIVAAFWLFAGHNTLDGSTSLYLRQKRNMQISLTVGVACEIVGIIFLIIRGRI